MSSRCPDALAFSLGVIALAIALATPVAARELRVCADPDDLPYSNRAGQGFENRIAALVGQDLGADVRYYWLPQWRGYARKTLSQHRCDVIPGIAQADDSVLATDAYYRGTYAFVYAPKRFPGLASLNDPRLRSLRIGIQVIGISMDADTTQANWAREANLPMTFASDTKGEAGKLYGSYTEGRQAEARLLYVVGPDGRIKWTAKPFKPMVAESYTELGTELKKIGGTK